MKKFIVIILAILMLLLTACGTPDVSKETTGKQSTTKAPVSTTAPATTGKDETTEAPDTTEPPVDVNYEISTVEELLVFMNSPDLGGDYILKNDITFNDTATVSTWATTAPTNIWTPVGSSTAPFYGTFNGQGHKIDGLYVKVDKYAGFFGCLSNATVENLVIGEGYISATSSVAGAVSAYYYGFTEVRHCINYATVSAKDYVGGIMGKFSDSAGLDVKVELCVNFGKIIGTLDTSAGYVGGIIGSCVGMTIDRCANFGEVSVGVGISDKGAIIGGIVGQMGSNQGYADSITNCYNAGKITSTQATGNAATAGIVGRMNPSNGEVSNCYNVGSLYVGGKTLAMLSYIAAENKDHLDYTSNVYNGGKVFLINTTEEVIPAFTEKGLKGSVKTGVGAVANMEFDATIWEDTASGTPILKDIDASYQIFAS